MLAEVATMDKDQKPEVSVIADGIKKITLKDGRYIRVVYGSDGQINCIDVSYDNASEKYGDGAEVAYYSDKALYNYDKSNGEFEGYIESGYDWYALKALAEDIFGTMDSN